MPGGVMPGGTQSCSTPICLSLEICLQNEGKNFLPPHTRLVVSSWLYWGGGWRRRGPERAALLRVLNSGAETPGENAP